MIQTLMGPSDVAIAVDVFPQRPAQMRLAQHNYMIEQFTPQRPDESLDKWILPGTSIGGANFVDAVVAHQFVQP